jgi:hypothetical protein
MKFDYRWAGLAAGMLLASGCTAPRGGGTSATGGTLRSTQVVAREKVAKAEMVKAEFNMGAGRLKLGGGAREFFEGEFAYNVASWKPEVRFDGGGFRGRLTVQQGAGGSALGRTKNEWVMRLANDIPLDVIIRCGAGESDVDLHDLTLRSAEVHLGAGQVDMDLRIKPVKDVDVRIEGGVGEAKVRVSRDTAVVAEASGGLGEIEVFGMKKDGSRWVTDGYGKGTATVRLTVKGGIGSIRIVAE